jgi:glycosyltransferase involved in cell wall biosynthesis
MILFGHPSGSPFSYNAALAHFEAGRLAAFCVPWMPSKTSLAILGSVPGWARMSQRLSRRRFEPLLGAPKVQGRLGEIRRLFLRSRGKDSEGLAYQANDWLMCTMKRECRREDVAAVHAYEDCSLWQFEEAKRLGKTCIYDMPIGYYPAWVQTQTELARKYSDWLPFGSLASNRWVRPEQKRAEMELADIVLAPSTFVAETILKFYPTKKVFLAPYGVDLEFWKPRSGEEQRRPNPDNSDFFADGAPATLKFIFAGQCSVRKGTPVLLNAWKQAALRNAKLQLVGAWGFADAKLADLPPGVSYLGIVSREELRHQFIQADVLVFPTYFEGRALVVSEALACGLPVVTTPASGVTDLVDDTCGRVLPSGDVDGLVETLRWFVANREKLPAMKAAARAKAETCSWGNYRRCVTEAIKSVQ